MNPSRLLRKCAASLLQGAAELLLFLPLPLLIAVYGLPSPVRWLWLATLPLLYAAGCAAALRLPLERRFPLHAAMAAAGALHAVVVLGFGLPALLTFPAGWVLARRGSRLAAEPWGAVLPPPAFAAGLLVHLAASFVLQFVPSFAPYQPALLWGGLTALGIALFRLNQARLQEETLNRSGTPLLPSAVMGPNRLWTALLLSGVLLLAFGSALEAALRAVLLRLAGLLASLLPEAQDPPMPEAGPAPSASPPVLPSAEDPPGWLQWLEQALLYGAGALLALLAIYLLYRLARRLPQGIRHLLAWLAERMNPAGRAGSTDGYEDEVVSLLRVPTDRHRSTGAGSRSREPRWKELRSGAERVRYLYRQWLRRQAAHGLQPAAHRTPAETVRAVSEALDAAGRPAGPAAAELLRLYEKVRYGEQPVTDEEAAGLQALLEAETKDKAKI
ncbi:MULTISPECIES: DUF4129 domain-containing protein [Paenibacillus]|uniref:DUF4129 domain-containing protein n=1 Tax=Paenibacillus TaxID=44249 RepID=UPI0022B91925|nr:DUF4129 domain-containing protein [Paenibacillus caseinilyticus]MCZ8524103.1 DUF4129 domain-containing protein [Paenibacillus caseinilyticus]